MIPIFIVGFFYVYLVSINYASFVNLFLFCLKGSFQNKFSVKVGNLAQGGGSDPIPTFINHCFYGIFDPFLPKISDKFMLHASLAHTS